VEPEKDMQRCKLFEIQFVIYLFPVKNLVENANHLCGSNHPIYHNPNHKKKKKKKERNVLIRIDFSKNSLENNRITTLLNSFKKILATITIIK